jgi:uncharacterized protein (DUF2141 family)
MTTKSFKLGALASVILMATISAVAQNQEIKVIIDNVKDDQGTLWVALHKPAEDYMKERFMFIQLTPIKGRVSGAFTDVPPGIYAISVLHDANNNKVVDKNSIGIPLEGVGFSNDAMGRFGPPEFKKVAFEVPKQKELVITMKYM